MSGWLITKPYEASGGTAKLEAFFAVWHADRDAALRMAKDFGPRGSGVRPRPVAALSESMLRGLRLRPGEAAILHGDRPWI